MTMCKEEWAHLKEENEALHADVKRLSEENKILRNKYVPYLDEEFLKASKLIAMKYLLDEDPKKSGKAQVINSLLTDISVARNERNAAYRALVWVQSNHVGWYAVQHMDHTEAFTAARAFVESEKETEK